jgi:hypothetical protein
MPPSDCSTPLRLMALRPTRGGMLCEQLDCNLLFRGLDLELDEPSFDHCNEAEAFCVAGDGVDDGSCRLSAKRNMVSRR